MGGLLAYEHSLIRPNDLKRLDAAFFTMNGVISVAVLRVRSLADVAFVAAGSPGCAEELGGPCGTLEDELACRAARERPALPLRAR